MDWLIFSIAAAVLLAVSTIFGRQLAKAYTFDMSLLGNVPAYPLAAAFAIFSILGSIAFLFALKQPGAKAGIVASVTSLNVVIVTLVSWLLFGETLSTSQLIGILLALSSVFLLSSG